MEESLVALLVGPIRSVIGNIAGICHKINIYENIAMLEAFCLHEINTIITIVFDCRFIGNKLCDLLRFNGTLCMRQ